MLSIVLGEFHSIVVDAVKGDGVFLRCFKMVFIEIDLHFDWKWISGLDYEGELLLKRLLSFVRLVALCFSRLVFADFISVRQVYIGPFKAKNSSLALHYKFIQFSKYS